MKFLRRKKSAMSLERLLDRCEVPAFPAVTMRILGKIRDPALSSRELAEALQWDPALVVQLLQMVNSAAFGVAQPIHDVAHASTYLGRSQVEQVVLALAIKDTLPRTPAQGFEPNRFWYAAAFRATLASTIADQIHPARRAESFTMGLLQDLALPVLATAMPDEYGPVLVRWHSDPHVHLVDLERDAFGWCHGEVGGALGRRWDLPSTLVRGIEQHHGRDAADPDLPPANRLVSVLREARAEHGIERLIEDARDAHGLEADWMRAAVAEAQQRASELAMSLA
ncbi:MAG: HDOD domain-containing protein [Planctomycetota bacterium]|nr:MAG: HDOD domain-containing protein [Planctomycetota bacterium]